VGVSVATLGVSVAIAPVSGADAEWRARSISSGVKERGCLESAMAFDAAYFAVAYRRLRARICWVSSGSSMPPTSQIL